MRAGPVLRRDEVSGAIVAVEVITYLQNLGFLENRSRLEGFYRYI
jgi:hypothetical protein